MQLQEKEKKVQSNGEVKRSEVDSIHIILRARTGTSKSVIFLDFAVTSRCRTDLRKAYLKRGIHFNGPY